MDFGESFGVFVRRGVAAWWAGKLKTWNAGNLKSKQLVPRGLVALVDARVTIVWSFFE
jgi:hypothetical protein